MSEPETLLQLSLSVPASRADEVAGRLSELCPEGFEEREGPADGSSHCFVIYGVGEAGEALRSQVEALAEALGRELGGAAVTLSVETRANENWREAWKVHFEIQHVDRFVIQPSWLPYEPQAGEHVIHLDPGSAFGTGLHESTRLCLRALLALEREGFVPRRVLDFGCGTGILALGAALLWGDCALAAVDNDPLAVQACAENVERNGQAGRVVVGDTLPAPSWELTVANVSRPVLCALAAALVGVTAPGGRLVLSGLLVEDRDAVAQAFATAGARILRSDREGEWLLLVLERTA